MQLVESSDQRVSVANHVDTINLLGDKKHDCPKKQPTNQEEQVSLEMELKTKNFRARWERFAAPPMRGIIYGRLWGPVTAEG